MVSGELCATAKGHPRERQVLDAAIQVFWEKGFASGSVQEVADRAGIPKTSLYRVISSKDELLFRIFDESHGNALEIMAGISSLDLKAVDRLHAYIVRFVAYYVENTEIVGLYYRERRFLGGDWAERLRVQRRDYDRFVGSLIETAQREGELPASLEPRLATFFVIGAINEISDWYQPELGTSSTEFAEDYAAIALAAIGAPL